MRAHPSISSLASLAPGGDWRLPYGQIVAGTCNLPISNIPLKFWSLVLRYSGVPNPLPGGVDARIRINPRKNFAGRPGWAALQFQPARFAVFARRTVIMFFKFTEEIRLVIEPGLIKDLGDA